MYDIFFCGLSSLGVDIFIIAVDVKEEFVVVPELVAEGLL